MTLPALIQNHRRGVAETALKKFYTNMNQAINLSVVDNGDKKSWTMAKDNTLNEAELFYNRYFKKYLKTLKAEPSDVQVNKNGTIVKAFTIFFADGSADAMYYHAKDHFYCINAKDLKNFEQKNGTTCFKFGFYTSPADFNFDTTTYSARNFLNKGLEPYVNNDIRDGEGNRVSDDDGNSIRTTEKDLYAQKCYAKIIQLNGWRIPKDYPLKF